MVKAPDSLLPTERLEEAALVMRVMAHPHRLRICELLLRERISVNEIAEHLGIPSNATSQHLGIMKAYGILGSEREGKTVYYRVISPQPAWVLACIRTHMPAQAGSAPSATGGSSLAPAGAAPPPTGG
ncbi:MAG: winged helix-turn-helix transcriptional regulator [Planctomycetes bacterium]|nr:winged helix-turn-helix transcriptional regulator [Planctomycetota bacterium]